MTGPHVSGTVPIRESGLAIVYWETVVVVILVVIDRKSSTLCAACFQTTISLHFNADPFLHETPAPQDKIYDVIQVVSFSPFIFLFLEKF